MTRKSYLRLALPVALVAAAACSATNNQSPPSGSGGSGPSSSSAMAQSLALTPADALLGVVKGGGTTLAYQAKLTLADGTVDDATGEANFGIDDPTLGSFTGATFTATGKVGTTFVRAKARGIEASTSLTLKGTTVFVTPGAPADAPSKFGGADDPGKAPSFVYPADGVLVPPNLNVFEFHFLPGTGNDLFELSLSTPSVDVKVYFKCTAVGQGCIYSPGPAVWQLVAEAGRGKDPVSYTVKGVSESDPSKVGTSGTQKISFGQQDIVGGLYYWNAGAGSTMRYEFGVSGSSAELFLNAAAAGGGICIGCHVLSRDGTKMAAGLDFPGAGYKVYDVATRKPIFSAAGASFFAFSPDSKQIMTADGGSVTLHDATTGDVIGDPAKPLISPGSMADWSPDGKSVVYAKSSSGIAVPTGVSAASLETFKFDGTTWAKGPTLVPFTSANNYYPSYSPDGGFVLFNRSAGDSYDAPDAAVWAIPSGGGTPVKLAAASTGGDSWPKWAPDVQPYKTGSIMWLTFSSRRAYGLRSTDGTTAQLWMTAFDPKKAVVGQDPSTAAFWLPFQDPATGNHIAQWVTKVERQMCGTATECNPGEQCTAGTCVPVPK